MEKHAIFPRAQTGSGPYQVGVFQKADDHDELTSKEQQLAAAEAELTNIKDA